MRLRLFTISILFFLTVKAFSQPYKYAYYFDDNYNTIEQSKATVIGKGYIDNSAFKLDFYNKATNKLLLAATYKDSTLGVLNGMFRNYFEDMRTESAGIYIDNEMDGVWQYWNYGGYKTDSVIYKNGIKTAFAKYIYDHSASYSVDSRTLKTSSSNDRYYLKTYSFTDSVNNTFYEKIFLRSKENLPILYLEVNFIGQQGILKEYDNTGTIIKTDSVSDRTFKEASFPGGDAAMSYLVRQKLDVNVPIANGAREGTYTVILNIVVNTDGTLNTAEVENDPGYGMGQEAIRAIKKLPKWSPAMKYGKPIQSNKRIPITFSFSSN